MKQLSSHLPILCIAFASSFSFANEETPSPPTELTQYVNCLGPALQSQSPPASDLTIAEEVCSNEKSALLLIVPEEVANSISNRVLDAIRSTIE